MQKRLLFLSSGSGAAYNRRLLEIVICAGNDYGRAGGDRPKGAGDIRFRVGRSLQAAAGSRLGADFMLNIPTDLLRTLVAVTDMRSFTKAAQSLGVTQPAVSAQIKRLQYLLGYEVLDKSAPGVSLTPRGEIVVNNARRLLSINDEILQLTSGTIPGQAIRVGIPIDYAGSRLPGTLARFRQHWPDISYNVSSGPVDEMLRDLKQGELDLVLALFTEEPTIAARHVWAQESVWVHSDATRIDPERPGAARLLWRATAPASALRSPRSIAPVATAISSSPRTAWSASWRRSRPVSA